MVIQMKRGGGRVFSSFSFFARSRGATSELSQTCRADELELLGENDSGLELKRD